MFFYRTQIESTLGITSNDKNIGENSLKHKFPYLSFRTNPHKC